MGKLIKLLFTIIFIYSVNHSYALTFKSDGTVISSSGETITKSFAERYQTALTQFLNGEEVTNWPIVKLSSFGSFLLKRKKPRVGRNPKTKVEALISERNVIVFRPSMQLKNKINLS